MEEKPETREHADEITQMIKQVAESYGNQVAKLLEETLQGNVASLQNLAAVEPSVIYRIIPVTKNTVLHNAALRGNALFVHHFLICMGLDEEFFSIQNRDGDTPLHLAVRAGHLEVVEHLIRYLSWARNIKKDLKEPLIIRNNEGNTLLHESVIHGRRIVTIKLLEGANQVTLNGSKLEGMVPMHVEDADKAVTTDHVLLLFGNAAGDTPLHLAARAGHQTDLDEYLIQYVVEKNLKEPLTMKNKKGNTLLHELVINHRSDVAVKLLEGAKKFTLMGRSLEEKINMHVEDPNEVVTLDYVLLLLSNADGDTSLHLAVKEKYQVAFDHFIRLVLQKNLKVNPVIMRNKEGNNPLHLAVMKGMSDMAIKLLDADPTCGFMLNLEMKSPLYIAVINGLDHVINKIAKQDFSLSSISVSDHGTALHQAVLAQSIRALEILLDKYVKLLDVPDSKDDFPIHYAAKVNDALIISMFLHKDSTLAYKLNRKQRTPLHVAVEHGSLDAVKELLKQSPDVGEKVDIMGQNIIHIAVINGRFEILKWLLKWYPEDLVNGQDTFGNTPLHLATELRLVEHAFLLLKDRRVNPCVVNKDGDTAFSISGRIGIMEMTANEVNLWKQLKKRDSTFKKQGLTIDGFKSQGRRGPNAIQIRTGVLVATLIAMATFSAILKSHRMSSTAVVEHQAFKLLVICSTISMCLSTVAILSSIWQLWNPVKNLLHGLIWTRRLIVLAGLTMVMSMLTTLYSTVELSPWLASVLISIGISTPFLCCLIMRPIYWWI